MVRLFSLKFAAAKMTETHGIKSREYR